MRVETIQPVDGGPGTRTPVKMACSLIRRLAIAQPRLGGSRRKREEANNGETRDDGELPPSPLPFRSPKRRPTVTATTLPLRLLALFPVHQSVGPSGNLGRCSLVRALHARAPFRPPSFFLPFLTFILGPCRRPAVHIIATAPPTNLQTCAHPPVDCSSTRTEGSNGSTTYPNKTAWFRGPFSHLPPPPAPTHRHRKLLASKYSQPRAASHAPARLRLSLCHPHCGWTPPKAQPQADESGCCCGESLWTSTRCFAIPPFCLRPPQYTLFATPSVSQLASGCPSRYLIASFGAEYLACDPNPPPQLPWLPQTKMRIPQVCVDSERTYRPHTSVPYTY